MELLPYWACGIELVTTRSCGGSHVLYLCDHVHMSNGTIIFCYQDVPIGSVSKITSSGLNIHHQDSLVYDTKKAFTNKTSRTLYKYHGFDLKSNAANI